MIIEYPLSFYLFLTINVALIILECFLLKNEARKCRKRANREKILEKKKEDLKENKSSSNHHALINKKLPTIKLKSIKIETPKIKEFKDNNVISLKFIIPKKNIKEVRDDGITENRRLEQARSAPF